MKRFTRPLAGLILLTLSATAQAETPVVEWTRQLGTAGHDNGCGVSVDVSGNAYVTGRTSGGLDGNTSAGLSDMFLTKISAVPEPIAAMSLLLGLLTVAAAPPLSERS